MENTRDGMVDRVRLNDHAGTGTVPAKKHSYSFERYGRRTFGNNITNSMQTSRPGSGKDESLLYSSGGLSRNADVQGSAVAKVVASHTPNVRDGQGDVVMEDAVVTPFIAPADRNTSGERVYDVFQTPQEEELGNDPPSEGKRLARQMQLVAQRLGTPCDRVVSVCKEGGRSLASASTDELKKPVARRMSILGDVQAPILDLNGFDAQGERRRHSIATPIIQQRKEDHIKAPSGRECAVLDPIQKECIEALEAKIAELEAHREEAGVILEGYQGSIAKLQDNYSKDVVTWTTENTLMSTEVERLRKERQKIHDQFSVLYNSKYLPLKEEVQKLREQLRRQQSSESEARAMGDELGVLKKRIESYGMSEVALKKSLEAAESQVQTAKEEARVACNRVEDVRQHCQLEAREAAREYQSKIEALEAALSHKDQRLGIAEQKILSMREQLEEALHQKEVATTGFQRKTLELQAREKELNSVQAQLHEKMSLLEEYKKTNEGFYEIKLGYKKKIQYLNTKLAEARMSSCAK